jgi:hypothetical protein
MCARHPNNAPASLKHERHQGSSRAPSFERLISLRIAWDEPSNDQIYMLKRCPASFQAAWRALSGKNICVGARCATARTS